MKFLHALAVLALVLGAYGAFGETVVQPRAATKRYGARVYRKTRGMMGGVPKLTVPAPWKLVEGDEGVTGCDSRLYYFTIEAPLSAGMDPPSPEVELSWPGVEIDATAGTRDVVKTADGLRFRPVAKSGGANYITMMTEGSIVCAFHHHVEGAQHGPYAGKPLPWNEIKASDNWRAAARDAFKRADLATPETTDGAHVNLFGFDSNYPNHHVDHPTHFHIMLEWNHFVENNVGHYVLDPEGKIMRNDFLVCGKVPGYDRSGYRLHKCGEKTDYNGPSGKTVFTVEMLADGTGIILTKPGCAKAWLMKSEKPAEYVMLYEGLTGMTGVSPVDAAKWTELGRYHVVDDTEKGEYRIVKKLLDGSETTEVFRYDRNTAALKR